MKPRYLMLHAFAGIALLLGSTQWTFAQNNSAAEGVPVSMVVTVQPQHASTMPDIGRQDVMVYQGHTRVQVTDWMPFQGEHAGLELFLLLDDSPDVSHGSQLEDLRNFIMAQPETTKIGVAYMQTGSPQIAQAPTPDHALAAKSLRSTLSPLAASASPYFSLSELIKNWPSGGARREIIMISNGIDHDWNASMAQYDAYVDSAIQPAQRAGIVVLTISTASGNNDLGSGPLMMARNSLSKIAEETGGGSYYQDSGVPVSIAPYLKDTAQQLSRQYLLTFLAKPEKKAGMQPVKVKTEVPHANLVSADRVYVPAAGQ